MLGPPLALSTTPEVNEEGTIARRIPRVVDGQHDGAPAAGTEDARQPVLHSPVQRSRSLQEERLVLGGNIQVEFFCLFYVINVSHVFFLL
jgi:hypothetical protein